MLINPKYKGYEDWQPTRLLKQGIKDLEPYLITYPTPPPIEEFINFGLKPNDQFFVREEKPDWMFRVNRMKREDALNTVKTNHYMAEWIDSQWRKRNEGVYMFIKGQPFYIPGKMWWYLNYYYQNTENGIDLGDFRYGDLEWFWIWCLFVLPDPNIYGLIDFTLRRDGKTARAVGEDLEEITKTASAKSGLQSKTDIAVRSTFQQFAVEPWRRLPWFFSPNFDNKTYPAKELNFRSSSRSGDNLDSSLLAKSVSNELGSSIECRTTVHTAFDQEKLHRYTLDEASKIVEMDVYECWRVVKQCLRIYGKIVGKAKITTTIEQMPKFGAASFFKIWDESNRTTLTKLFQTQSGLVPVFKAGEESYLLDQHGFPIIHTPTPEQSEYLKKKYLKEGRVREVEAGYHKIGARELLEMEAATFENAQDRQAFYRMYPPSIAIARRTDGKDCAFPAQVHIIEDRLDELKYGLDDCFVGNLRWKNNIEDSEVEWVPCQHSDRYGKRYGYECPSCMFRFFTMDFLPYTNRNYCDEHGYLCPGNKGKGLISADTFKYDVIKSKEGSYAASHGYMEFDISIDQGRDHKDQVTDDFIFEFLFRTKTTKAFSEEMRKVCFWLGWQIFPEINLPKVWNDFVEFGYEKFLKYPQALKKKDGRYIIEQSETPGIITLGGQSKLPTFSATEEYLDRCGYKCKAYHFLSDCRVVEFAKLTEYDAFVSGSQCLYGRTPVTKFKPKAPKNIRKGLDGMLVLRRAGT